ncbi:unnamed protein product [Amoebophrya sp. A25]|nr:unnamed protein product [Amoebophrya sp. A25]|eukprot:GSA25T00007574001.1
MPVKLNIKPEEMSPKSRAATENLREKIEQEKAAAAKALAAISCIEGLRAGMPPALDKRAADGAQSAAAHMRDGLATIYKEGPRERELDRVRLALEKTSPIEFLKSLEYFRSFILLRYFPAFFLSPFCLTCSKNNNVIR